MEVENRKNFSNISNELRYDIYNLGNFLAQKRGTPLKNKSKFKSYVVKSPLLFIKVTHITSLLSKAKGKRKNELN